MRWNTTERKQHLEAIRGVAAVEVTLPGGDVDTEALVVHPKDGGDRLWVRGFITSFSELDPKDAEVEMIEVSDGMDSRGGLNSSHPVTCEVYGRIVSALRMLGFTVVPQLKDYF